MQIKLIIGLGNPGKEYENTRHNTGFVLIDEIAQQLKSPDFKYEKKTLSEVTTFRRSSESGTIDNLKSKVILAKPQTFMNKSGAAVLALVKQFKIKPENVLVVHDDVDISWGNFKFSFGRRSAGHKGVESVIKALKTKNFWRLRIGIQPIRPTQGKPSLKKHISADKIILKKFTPGELKELDKVMKKAIHQLADSFL
ncbi:MAG: aminoacyl-tRNA hydrolase [Parcubacteria group bacterium]|nr:aminoacyl-tRNA hydrolase [Parcubacteria group bacterium]